MFLKTGTRSLSEKQLLVSVGEVYSGDRPSSFPLETEQNRLRVVDRKPTPELKGRTQKWCTTTAVYGRRHRLVSWTKQTECGSRASERDETVAGSGVCPYAQWAIVRLDTLLYGVRVWARGRRGVSSTPACRTAARHVTWEPMDDYPDPT